MRLVSAESADAADPLGGLRERFDLPAGICYLDGNSLGALPRGVAEAVRVTVEDEWGVGLIRSWNDACWLGLPRRVAERLAPLVGADADEIAVTDSTSVNLYRTLAAARSLRPGRRVVLTDRANFPSDRYVARGLADLLGDVEVVAVAPDDVGRHLDDRVAVLTLAHVDYRTGALHDAAALTRAAHRAGALTVWDLSHSTGAVEVDLHGWDVDLAVGCTYKFLNGGPGAPAYAYAARRLHAELSNPVAGWFSHRRPFDFDAGYEPAPDARRLLGGTPPVLSMAALATALEAFDGVDPVAMARKAQELVDRFRSRVEQRLAGHVEVVGPARGMPRGAQVSLRHPGAAAVMSALIARGVVGDHRPPDLLRFGFSPLYVRHVDVETAVDVLEDVLETRSWDTPEHHAPRTVT